LPVDRTVRLLRISFCGSLREQRKRLYAWSIKIRAVRAVVNCEVSPWPSHRSLGSSLARCSLKLCDRLRPSPESILPHTAHHCFLLRLVMCFVDGLFGMMRFRGGHDHGRTTEKSRSEASAVDTNPSVPLLGALSTVECHGGKISNCFELQDKIS
jgi:hypothetical protein